MNVAEARIRNHPVLTFPAGRRVTFTLDGRELEGLEGEPIAAALHAAGVRVLAHSPNLHRPRGFYCAIGNCSSCLMTVDGEPNVRVCVEKLHAGMQVVTQDGRGELRAQA
jgi:predicted molibdopterin-dependent oxidoreductase YjgC